MTAVASEEIVALIEDVSVASPGGVTKSLLLLTVSLGRGTDDNDRYGGVLEAVL